MASKRGKVLLRRKSQRNIYRVTERNVREFWTERISCDYIKFKNGLTGTLRKGIHSPEKLKDMPDFFVTYIVLIPTKKTKLEKVYLQFLILAYRIKAKQYNRSKCYQKDRSFFCFNYGKIHITYNLASEPF